MIHILLYKITFLGKPGSTNITLQLLSTLLKKTIVPPRSFYETYKLQFLLTDLKSSSLLSCSSLPCGWLLRNETELEQSALAIIHLPSLLQGDGHLREILGGDNFNLLPITILTRHLLQKCDNKGKEFADRAMRAVQCEGSY